MGNDFTTLLPMLANCGPATGEFRSRAISHIRPSLPVRDPLTERALTTWSAGDYDRIAAGFRREANAFVERLGLRRGLDVLDAACGTGNLTIPAAKSGARVTGFDLVPALLEVAARRAIMDQLWINFDQGTVEEVPYADGKFDVVMSMFGVMFAPRPERVVAELARVTRRGGRVALANWTPDGFVGQMLKAHVAYVPAPEDVPSPLRWGSDAVIRELFGPDNWEVHTQVRTLTFTYPHMPAGTADLFRVAYGPTVRAMALLDTERRELFAAELTDLWQRHQRAGAIVTEVDSEYLEVVVVRR
jgi:ubiquinone/menaquinone biosynthesis C-methylase UbiE